MNLTPVDSSYIAACGYDESSKHLTIQFKDGSTFGYAAVPANIYQAFQTSKSKGKFFHAVIKGRYAELCIGKDTRPSVKEDKVSLSPVFLALHRCKHTMAINPAGMAYFLWAACGKPDRSGTGRNSVWYRACVELVVEAGNGTFGPEHIDKAIALAKERRI